MRLPNGASCADVGEVSSTWGTWLHGYPWGWWCHLTFLIPPSRERAEALFKAWLHGINRKLFGHNYYRYHDGARWVRGIEWQRRGAIHFHVLIAEADRLKIADAVKSWKKLSGGDAKIELYDREQDATHYLAKVYAGRQTGEIHLGGRWPSRASNLVGRVA